MSIKHREDLIRSTAVQEPNAYGQPSGYRANMVAKGKQPYKYRLDFVQYVLNLWIRRLALMSC
jgi:hypothetical protein